jgi:uncharacterized membrane protein YqjE
MDIATLLSLRRIGPVLLRHLSAYADLAGQDLVASRKDLVTRLRAALIFSVCGAFALLMGCIWVIAATWDTPHRMLAIGMMTTLFAVLALVAGLFATRTSRQPAFASVRREWREDRLILEHVLSGAPDETSTGEVS